MSCSRLPAVLWLPALLLAVPGLLFAPLALAADCNVDGGAGGFFWFNVAGTSSEQDDTSCGSHCAKPVLRGEVAPQLVDQACLPLVSSCEIEVRVPFDFPHNHENSSQFSRPVIWWFEGTPPENCPLQGCTEIASCGAIGGITGDFVDTVIRIEAFCKTLGQPSHQLYTAQGRACPLTSSCLETLDVPVDLRPEKLAELLECPPPPPPEKCNNDAQCTTCPAPGVSIGGGGPGAGGPGGPGGDGGRNGDGAYLYYAAGAVGHPGLPGSDDWNVTLGRYWSHDYTERIVEDPDDSHVWLITKYGTFREFGNLAGGVYQVLAPSDEYRTLYRTGGGWELHDLDGTVMAFDNSGLWLSTTDRNGNAKIATYSGTVLDSVAFPDGRREDFSYHPDGKLASITMVGIDNLTTRDWLYTWTGDDLTRVDRPDGTALEYFYGDLNHPGYLTRIDLVGTDGTSRRVLRGYKLDLDGNVETTWKGDIDPAGPEAVEVWSFAYDSGTETTVTDPLGQQIVYTYDRDPDSAKVRLQQIEGDCPACGLGPNTVLTYDDAANPLLPTREVDGNGNVTEMGYDANGRMTSRTEAVGTAEERTTTWTYDATYPGLVTEISRPSVQSGAERQTLMTRDANGNAVAQEVRGFEDGLAFDCTVGGAPCYETTTTYNAAGMPLTVDPPGYAAADATAYSYDPARGDLVMDSRTDPLIGTTTYQHDPFNRRTATTNPNGVTSTTVYDELGRVVQTIHHGATAAEDLVTVHEHDAFGDLLRTILPEGNVIEYGHDPAGRLVSIERKPDVATPGERTLYGLDAAGNRTSEQLQRWDPGTATWITESSTAYLFTTRCHLDQVLHPDGTITEYAFDCNGNLERTWDANHPSAGKTAEPTATYSYL